MHAIHMHGFPIQHVYSLDNLLRFRTACLLNQELGNEVQFRPRVDQGLYLTLAAIQQAYLDIEA